MKNNYKTYAKKSLSLFMAVMMLLSCWVWIAPQKAEAAVGEYTITIKWNLNYNNIKDDGYLRVDYYPFKDDGKTIDTDNPVNDYVLLSTWDGKNDKGDYSITEAIPGFPFNIDVKYDRTGIYNCWRLKQIIIGDETIFNDTITVTRNQHRDFSMQGAAAGNSDMWGGAASSVASKWTLPVAETAENSTLSGLAVTVPNDGSTGTSSSVTAKFYDQYGVECRVGGYTTSFSPSCAATGNYNGVNGVSVSASHDVFTGLSNYSTTSGSGTSTMTIKCGTASSTCVVTFNSSQYWVPFGGCGCGKAHDKECYYNGTVTVPDGCAKATDENGHYSFDGWMVEGDPEEKVALRPGAEIKNIKVNNETKYVAKYTCTPHQFDVKNGDYDYFYNDGSAQGTALGNHSRKCTVDENCTYRGIGTYLQSHANGKQECTGTWVISGSAHTMTCTGCGKTYTHTPAASDWEVTGKKSDANCQTPQINNVKCKICGLTDEQEYGSPDASKHIAQDDYTILVNPTCIEKGRQVKYCIHHNTVIVVDEEIPATGVHTPAGDYEIYSETQHAQRCSMCHQLVPPYRNHNYDYANGKETVKAECGKPGVMTYTCKDCPATITEEIPALEHNYVDFSDETHVETDSTCVLPGVRYEKCENCGDIKSIEKELDATNHNYVFTNLEDEGHGYVCINEDAEGNRCGYKNNVESHKWDDGVVTKEPTCIAEGEKLFTCTDNCGATYIEILPVDKVNGHNMSDATPDANGTTHSAVCSICKETVTQDCVRGEHCICSCGRQMEHSMVVDLDDKKSDATCKDLAVYGTKCEYCGDKGVGTLTYGELADHAWDSTNKGSKVSDATCETGSVYYKYCAVCETYANNATHDIPAELTWEDTDALGHNYNGDYVTHGDGTHSYKCERYDACKSYGVGTEKGKTEKCVAQGAYINKTETTHSQKCLCGYEIVTEHKYVSNPDKTGIAPTCNATGMKYEICEECGYEKETVLDIDPTAHNWDTSEYVCITDGKDGAHAFNCLNGCGKTGTPDKGEGGTYAHKWSEGVVTNAPTCNAEGEKLHTCEAPGCGATYTEILAKDYTNHVDENGNAYETTPDGTYKAPTCITEGFSGNENCNVCGHIAKTGEVIPVDPNAHRQEALTDFTGKEATCTEPGYADYAYCSDCNKAVSSEDGVTIIPALGHDFDDVTPEKVKDADKHVYSCTRCGELKYEACSGGEATCKDKAVCEKCGAEYGETTDHTTENAEWVAGGTDAETDKYIHVKKCDVCDEIAETEECAGGNPTCTEAAKCATCGQEHKAARGHDFTGKARPTEDGKHEYKCTRCDVYGAEADCSLTKTETRVAPTCTETAYYKYECDDCGYKWEVKYAEGDEIPAEDAALGHEYTDMMPDAAHLYKEGTCKAEGPAQNIYWYDCSRCNKSAATLIEEGMTEEELAEIVNTYTYAYGAAAEHNFNGRTWYEGAELATEADCENDATYYVYCTVCKTSSKGVEGKEATFIDYNSATEHEWVNDTDEEYLKSKATCVAKAVYYKSCSNCGTKSTITFEHGDVLAHVFEQKILDYAHRINRANCTSMASYWYDCKNCNVNAKNIDKTGMTDEEVEALKFVDEESGLDLTNHTAIETVPVKNPTCTEAGHSAYKICTDCNTPITEKVDYEKLSHDFSGAYKYYVATEEGQKDQHNRKCKNCDAYGYAVDGVQTVDAKVECTFGEWSQVTGTETHEQFCECGNKKTGTCASETSSPSCTEKATCDTCGGKFGETSEHNKATEWTYSDETVGYHVKVCTVCDEVLETQSCYGGTATCGQQAVCEFCNRGYGKTPDHTYGEWIDDAEKPATCTEAKWQYRYCTVCKAESTKQTQQAGKPLGHDISDWYYATEEDKPTCADEGLMTKTCSRCDLKETKVVPVDLDIHDEYIANEIGRWEKEDGAADCVNGVVWYLYCNVCGKKLDSKIESGEHQWKEIANVKATCTEDGYIIYKCDICGFTDTQYPEDMKSEGHVWGEEVIEKQPTCGAAGRAYQLCAKCNAKSEKYAVPATGHGPDVTPQYTIIVEPVAATCTSTGHNGYWKCKRCSYDEHLDESSDYKVYPKLPHTDTDGDGLCDECLGKIYTDDSGKDKSCNCMCHNDSFLMQFFYKIAKFFWKLFGTNKSCACGYEHY